MKTFDVVICGGGVIGSSIAYFLSKNKDLKIALVDFKHPGNASRASAGGLWPMGESTGLGCGVILFKTLSKQMQESGSGVTPQMSPHIMPKPFFDMAMQSNAMYPSLYEELKENHNVDFKFERTGLKFVMFDKYDKMYAEHIAAAVPERKNHIAWLSQSELRTQEPNVSLDAIGAMQFDCDHQVNPYRLNEAYLEAARQNGVELFLNTKIVGIEKDGNRISAVKTEQGRLACKAVVNSAGAWAETISKWATGYPLPVFPVKGQVIVTEKLPKVLNGCLTTSDCYIAQKDNGEILIGSTTEEKGFDVTNDIKYIKQLGMGAIKSLPILKDMNIKRCWAGLRPGSPDELPILGSVPGVEGYFNACGHFRTGILTSAITGKVMNQIIRGLKPEIDIAPFSYSRFLNTSGEMKANYQLEHAL